MRAVAEVLEVDHVFVLVSAGAPEAEALHRLGLVEGDPNVHPGQGTANRRFFFRQGMLELLYVSDEAAARTGDPRLKLWERWAGRRDAASPFGICFRAVKAAKVELPFPSWRYRPPYLNRQRLDVAESSERIEEPLLFHLPFAAGLDRHLAEHRQPTDHPAGMRDLTGVRVGVPAELDPSPSLRGVERAGLLRLARTAGPLLELSFDGEAADRREDFRPELPLVLRW